MNELELLALYALFTGLMWVPYILDRIMQTGLIPTVGYPDELKQSAWGERARRAHVNAVENLVVFAALALSAHALDALTATTLQAAQLFVSARILHYIFYIAKVPWLRTVAFAAGFAGQVMLATTILT